jgi:hypothetical protein
MKTRREVIQLLKMAVEELEDIHAETSPLEYQKAFIRIQTLLQIIEPIQDRNENKQDTSNNEEEYNEELLLDTHLKAIAEPIEESADNAQFPTDIPSTSTLEKRTRLHPTDRCQICGAPMEVLSQAPYVAFCSNKGCSNYRA